MGPIGVFDSGYGGLTVFKEIMRELPDYDYIYLGDNARVPYGTRSFDTVYRYTSECIQKLFSMGCRLVILACNTASAKALRSFQKNDLLKIKELHRVLGVIRPTTEIIGEMTKTGHIGVFATQGTVDSESYVIEVNKFFPEKKIFQEACPMWVPLVENNEHMTEGADYFIKKNINNLLAKSSDIDTIILACTHYPLIKEKVKEFLPAHINLLSQGEIVATSLVDYLKRHPEIEELCSRNKKVTFYTTESTQKFDSKAEIFLGKKVSAKYLDI